MQVRRPYGKGGALRVSFVVPCFNEQDNIEAFHAEFARAFEGSAFEWRLVMVDDGSTDATWEKISSLAATDARVSGLRFSRNFGKEAAIYAGLEECVDASDYMGIIDADLQQQPSVARDMLELLDSKPEVDCVAAYQEERREGALVSFLKKRFYSIFTSMTRSKVVADASDFRVFRRSVGEAVLSMTEYHRFSKGIFAWVGFETEPYPYTPASRNAGDSKWSIGSLFRYAFEGILSFSTAPLTFIAGAGLVVSIGALIYAIVLIIRTLAFGIDVPGYASSVALILLLGGVQLFALGVIGEYLARAYIQGKERPVYILKSSVNCDGDPDDADGRF